GRALQGGDDGGQARLCRAHGGVGDVVLGCQRALFDVGQDTGDPGPPRRSRRGAVGGPAVGELRRVGREPLVRADVVVDGDAELLEVVLTLRVGRRLTHLLYGGHEQADENGDDGDDYQQLNQR